MVNVQTLQQGLDHIEAHPEEWQQKSWFSPKRPPARLSSSWFPEARPRILTCETAACLAGTVTKQAGYLPVIKPMDSWVWRVILPSDLDGRNFAELSSYEIEGLSGEIPVVAAELLGLTASEADVLFHEDNTRLDLWAIAYVLTEGQIFLPADIGREDIRDYWSPSPSVVVGKVRHGKPYLALLNSYADLLFRTAAVE
jgi:hypothetical protein